MQSEPNFVDIESEDVHTSFKKPKKQLNEQQLQHLALIREKALMKKKEMKMITEKANNLKEFEIMKEDVAISKELGCQGIVIGILRKDGNIDSERCAQLIDIAGGLEITFHRAFDRCSDLERSLEDIIQLGCHRVLTSGAKENAFEGLAVLKSLVIQAGSRISIMPGSGINEQNLAQIAHETAAIEFHTTAKSLIEYGFDPTIGKAYSTFETSSQKVAQLKQILSHI